jgi:hypothetical protein
MSAVPKSFTWHFKMNDGRLLYGDGPSQEEAARQGGISLADVKRFMPVKLLTREPMSDETRALLRDLNRRKRQEEADDMEKAEATEAGTAEAETNDKEKAVKTKSNTKAKTATKKAAKVSAKRAGNVKRKDGQRYVNAPKEGTIGATVLALLTDGKTEPTFEAIGKVIKKKFPKSKFNSGHLSWYKRHFVDDLKAKVNKKED